MNDLKIISASITNFKNISSKIVKIDGRSLVIIGSNAIGKSSLIQALLSPLDPKYVPSKPIKEGEEKGNIQLKIGGQMDGVPKTYDVAVYFTPANQSGRFVCYNELGEEMKPAKTFLKGLIGQIGFDIFQFLRDKPKEQVEQLKQIAGINFNKINQERQKIYDDRAYINKKISEEEALLKNHGYSDSDIGKYAKPIDVAPVKQKINDLGKSIQDYSNIESGLKSREDKLDAGLKRVSSITSEIAELFVRIETLKNEQEQKIKENDSVKEEIAKAKAWLGKTVRPDITNLNEELSAAEEHNRHHEKIEQFKKKNIELNGLKTKSEEFTQAIKDIDEKKEKMISESKLPVKGLTFTDESPLYNGLPLEDGQINKAKLIEIGARIGMALNPTLKVMFVWDASLLDKDSMSALVKLCDEAGYQLFLEVVNFDGDKELDIKFTEEYLSA